MPLSPPAPREHIHTRAIEVQGFRRADGLWDLDGHLTDCKGYRYRNQWRGELAEGELLHDMSLRLTIDEGFVIHAVEAVIDAHPFPDCPGAIDSFQNLVGLRLGPGWQRKARQQVGGTAGCTHLVELLGPLATVAYQTIGTLRMGGNEGPELQMMFDSCRGWSRDGEAVRVLYPAHYRGEQE